MVTMLKLFMKMLRTLKMKFYHQVVQSLLKQLHIDTEGIQSLIEICIGQVMKLNTGKKKKTLLKDILVN